MFDSDTKILLVEDTEITRSIMRKMLAKLGYKRVVEAENGRVAWEELEKSLNSRNHYGLIICDWKMPEMNGLELLKKMQIIEAFRSTAFILLTSNIEKEQVVEAIQSGVSVYLAKPFPSEVLQKKIKEAWDLQRRRKAG